MASVSRPWRNRSDRAAAVPLAVYLLPAVIGGGRGDIEDLRAVGELLRSSGVPILLPVGAPGVPKLTPRERKLWTFARADRRLARRAVRALTVVPQFGVAAAAARPGPYGRAGPWAGVIAALERAYGPDRVVHVSLEEFARNLSAAQQESERLREGGIPLRRIRARRRTRAGARDVARMRRLWRRYHELDRPNLLHLVPTFVGSRACRRDFPELVECGPVPPPPGKVLRRPRRAPRSRGPARWVWYASPSTSPILLDGLAEGSRRAGRSLTIALRSPRPFPPRRLPGTLRLEPVGDLARGAWEQRFGEADLRIVTGSRSLLEALAVGGPFLYFHGATGSGARRRVHRPEKILGLLRLWRSAGVSDALRRDLSDFARGRRVAGIVERALGDPAWARSFPARPLVPRLPARRSDGGQVIRALVAGWSSSTRTAGEFVAEQRLGNRR